MGKIRNGLVTRSPQPAGAGADGRAMIELTNISKAYSMGHQTLLVLKSVNLKIKANEFVAIVGPSGSGKSTLMNILGCLDQPDEGDYYLDGENVAECSDRQLATIRNRKIGFIFQQFNLLSKLSALENVELPLVYQGVTAHECRQRALAELTRVGLADRVKHKPNELSGGQQQRVAIARALVTRPALLLADEPTGNLDSRSGREILELLHRLHDEGHTIVMITHDRYIAEAAARRVIIYDGVVSEDAGAGHPGAGSGSGTGASQPDSSRQLLSEDVIDA